MKNKDTADSFCLYYTFNYAKGVLLLFIYRIALRDIERKVREMAKKIASEKLDEEDGSIVIDADEEQATIDDLPGVGPATAEKLREAGFEELLAIAVMSPNELAEQAELGEAVSSKIIQGAKKMANIGGFL